MGAPVYFGLSRLILEAKTIGFVKFLVVLNPEMSKNHWFCSVFVGFEPKHIQKPLVSSCFLVALNPKMSKNNCFYKVLVVFKTKM